MKTLTPLLVACLLAGCALDTIHYGRTKDEWTTELGQPTRKYYLPITDQAALSEILTETADPQCSLNQRVKVGDMVEVLIWRKRRTEHTLMFLNNEQEPSAAWSSTKDR